MTTTITKRTLTIRIKTPLNMNGKHEVVRFVFCFCLVAQCSMRVNQVAAEAGGHLGGKTHFGDKCSGMFWLQMAMVRRKTRLS